MNAIKYTAFNVAMSYMLSNAMTGEYPDFSIDMSKVLVSRVSLTGALNGTATSVNSVFTLVWDENSGSGNANQTDKTLIVVFNPARAESVFTTGGNQRIAGTEDIAVPSDWVGEGVEVFLGFITEDGKDVANSSYLGSVTIS